MSEPTSPTSPTSPPVARSPITPAPPVAVVAGWEVSARRSDAETTITDLTPLTKVQVKAPWNGRTARALDVPFGIAARDTHGNLVIGAGPGEWLLLAPPGTAVEVVERLHQLTTDAADDELVTVLDLTHGRALVRIAGERTADLLAKICGIDLGESVTPDGTAFRTAVAHLATDVVRDDLPEGTRSYLLHCERSSGRYLLGALLDAGSEYGIEIDGFPAPGI